MDVHLKTNIKGSLNFFPFAYYRDIEVWYRPCHTLCADCTNGTAKDCGTCITGATKVAGECKCNPGTFADVATSNCGATCPSGFKGNNDTQVCVDVSNCDKFDATKDWLCKPGGCKKGFMSFNGTCLKDCPGNTKENNTHCELIPCIDPNFTN